MKHELMTRLLITDYVRKEHGEYEGKKEQPQLPACGGLQAQGELVILHGLPLRR